MLIDEYQAIINKSQYNNSDIDTFMDNIFKNDELFCKFYENLQHYLDSFDDKRVENMIELLTYWNKEEDYSKMDKLTIIYKYKQLL